MDHLLWNPDWDTHIKSVDAEHRELFNYIDKVFQAIHDNSPVDFEAAAGMLLEFTDRHFSNEVQMMRDANYPLLNQHMEFHQEFSSRVSALLDSQSLSEDVLSLLTDYLIDHINIEDRKFANWLRSTSLLTD